MNELDDAPLDPRHLPRTYSPAVVYTDDERTFFADVTLLDNGWAVCKRWDESRVKVPAHRIHQIEMAETESTRSLCDGTVQQATHGLVDDEALEEARRRAQPIADDVGGTQGAVADD